MDAIDYIRGYYRIPKDILISDSKHRMIPFDVVKLLMEEYAKDKLQEQKIKKLACKSCKGKNLVIDEVTFYCKDCHNAYYIEEGEKVL